MEVRTAGDLGYCSGVSQAITKVAAYARDNGPVSSLGTIAHNEQVVEFLRACGVEPIKPEEMLPAQHVAITAHGSPPWVYEKIEELGCASVDCTCPIVKKVQKTVAGLHDQGFDIIIFGDPGHQEVKGLVGWAKGNAKFVGVWHDLFIPGGELVELKLERAGVVSQTTQVPEAYSDFVATLTHHHLDEVEELRIVNTVCPIVASRVNEARKLAGEVDIMFVVGSQESANTNNLAKVCTEVRGTGGVLIVQGPDQVHHGGYGWWDTARGKKVGVTAGTSTPIEMVEAVVEKLREI